MSSGEQGAEPVDQIGDAELIRRSLHDPEVFSVVYDRYASYLVRYLVRRVPSVAVENLLADVFVVAFERRGRFVGSRPTALPWLYGIAGNVVRRYFRSHHRERSAHDRLVSLTGAGDHRPPLDDLVSASADASGQVDQILALLVDQPEIDREVLMLFAWEDLSYVEIAEVLDIPVGTVKSRLNRIRRTLRRML